MSRKVHPRTVLLLSAARPSINLTFSCKVFYSSFFFVKQIHRAQIILKIAGDTLSLTTIVFVRHFENEIPLTINHGREMSTILAMMSFALAVNKSPVVYFLSRALDVI